MYTILASSLSHEGIMLLLRRSGTRACQHLSMIRVCSSIVSAAQCSAPPRFSAKGADGTHHHSPTQRCYGHYVASSCMSVRTSSMHTTGLYTHSHPSRPGARLNL